MIANRLICSSGSRSGRLIYRGCGIFVDITPRYCDSSFSFSTLGTTPSDELKTTGTSKTKVRIYNALNRGCMDYSKSWAWQHALLSRRLHQRRDSNGSVESDFDSLLFLEHHPVYTLGRGADENHLTFVAEAEAASETGDDISELIHEVQTKLSTKVRGPGTARLAIDRQMSIDTESLSIEEAIEQLCNISSPVIAPNGVPIYRVERGGEVTFHGPSQLVVYPLLDLASGRPYQKDLHWYLRQVEEVVIQTLAHYDIEAYRDEDNTGVWVDDAKVAAVGISASKWITTHGFALNVNPNLEYFDTRHILPCGIEGKGVTSIARILKDRSNGDDPIPTIQEVANVVGTKMEAVFGISLIIAEE